MSRHCYVVNCSKGDYQLERHWKSVQCDKHSVFHGDPGCDCKPPFRLFQFPGKVVEPEKRKMWLQAINRADPKRLHSWLEPSRSQVVCSNHFVDGYPSVLHPLPELHLGAAPKRAAETEASNERKKRQHQRETKKNAEYTSPTMHHEETQPVTYPPMSLLGFKVIIFLLLSVIRKHQKEISEVKNENASFQKQLQILKKRKSQQPITKSIFSQIIRNDRDANFYSGIGKISLFQKLHNYVAPFVRRRWKGMKTLGSKVRNFRHSPKKFGPQRKLTSIDEFLLTLMKLRLGLLNDNLAKRFNISLTLVSQIFHSWLATLSNFLGSAVIWPTKEQVIGSKPSRFAKLPDLRCIIDCSELFIETPKYPNLQNATWSNCKHHNTVKFLVGIAPTSAITFLSPVYGGRTSDKDITLDSGFLDKCEPYDMIQADKGFNIQEECDARLLTLHVPPGKRGQAQMTSVVVEKTKRIANLRILVEQVIRRLKTFRILSTQFQITLLPFCDKIINCVCSSL